MRLPSRSLSHWLTAFACLAAVGASTAVAVAREPAGDGTHPVARAGATASATAGATPTAHTLQFGIAYGDTLLNAPSSTLDKGLDDAVAVGAKWIRVDLPWSAVQPQSGDAYDWSGFDQIAGAAHSRGLKIDAILDQVPTWARAASCRSNYQCPPADLSQFANFAAAAAHHYASYGMTTWEVWNEPNLSWAPKADPTAYAALLASTSRALRTAEPGAFVILGGLAPVNTNQSTGQINSYDFLTDVVKAGGTGDFDAVGYHPYTAPTTMPAQSPNFQAISSSPQNLVGVLQRYGSKHPLIWITETGYEVTDALKDRDAENAATKAQEQEQALYATDVVKTVAPNPYVGGLFWYSDQDAVQGNLYFGLRRVDGSERPAFSTLKAAISACACSTG